MCMLGEMTSKAHTHAQKEADFKVMQKANPWVISNELFGCEPDNM